MGLKKSHFFGTIRIDLRIEKRFLKREDIHNKLHSMSNAKVQISNQILSSSVKSPQPPFAKGGRGGIID
jgi:hypothetical protein